MVSSLTSTQPIRTPMDSLIYSPDKNGLTAKGPDIPNLVRMPDKDGFTARTGIPDGASTCDNNKEDEHADPQWGKTIGVTALGVAILTFLYKGKGITEGIKKLFHK